MGTMTATKKNNYIKYLVGGSLLLGTACLGLYYQNKNKRKAQFKLDAKGKPEPSSDLAQHFNNSKLLVGPSSWRLDNSYKAYKTTKIFTKTTVSKGLLNDHNTKRGVDALIHVVEGKLKYVVRDTGDVPNQQFIIVAGQYGIIKSQQYHKVEFLTDNTKFYVEFWDKKQH